MGVTPRLQNQLNLIGNKSKLHNNGSLNGGVSSIDSSSGESGYGQRKVPTQGTLTGSSIASGASAFEVMTNAQEALQNSNGNTMNGDNSLSQQQRYASILSQNRARRMNKF